MVRAGSRKWESQGDVYAFVKGLQLQWDQSLIVIHTKYRVEFALNRAVENRVWRVWTRKWRRVIGDQGSVQFLYCRRNDIDFFAPDLA